MGPTLTALVDELNALQADRDHFAAELEIADRIIQSDGSKITELGKRIEALLAEIERLQVRIAELEAVLAACPEPEPTLEPSPVIYRDTFAGGKHAPYTGGFAYAAPAPGAGSSFTFTKDELGRDVFRLNISADGDDNRNEQRFSFSERRKLFVGFRRRMSPNFTHEDMPGPDNWKQLRLFSEPYDVAGGIHVGFSLLPFLAGEPGAKLLLEAVSNTSSGGLLYPCSNKGTWDRVALPGLDERWGFWVELASGPGAKDGRIQVWYQGIDLTARSAAKTGFDWNALDLWNYMEGARNYFDRGFFPGWDNAGSTNPEFLDYHEFVIADAPLPEYTS